MDRKEPFGAMRSLRRAYEQSPAFKWKSAVARLRAGPQTDALIARLLGNATPTGPVPAYSSNLEAAFALGEFFKAAGKLEAYAFDLLAVAAPGEEGIHRLGRARDRHLAAVAQATALDRAKAALLTHGPPAGFPEVWPEELPRN